MPIVYCLVHNHAFPSGIANRIEVGFYESPARAEDARLGAIKLPGFRERPESFVVETFRLDDADEDGAPPQMFFSLYFDREIVHRDAAGNILFYEDIEKTLGVYSTAVKAAEALVTRLREPEYADYATCFSISGGELNSTGWETGYFTPDDEERQS